MKKLVMIFLTIICLLSLVACANYTPANVTNSADITVVIDAGHGGADAGAIGIDGTMEKDINLAIALDLYDYLIVSGFDAVLVRDGDYEIYPDGIDRRRSDLYNRMDFINSVDNAVLVSVHQNHFDDETEWGTQAWYSPNDTKSKRIADSILCNVKDFLQPSNNRSNKMSDDSYYLLYKASAPSVMVECGFISNREENLKLQDKEYQKDIAYSIAIGLNGEI